MEDFNVGDFPGTAREAMSEFGGQKKAWRRKRLRRNVDTYAPGSGPLVCNI